MMSRLEQCASVGDGLISSSKSENKIALSEHEVYEKVKHLGDGSFSTVALYRKVNRKTGEQKYVALKKLNIESLTSESNRKVLEQAINEIKILSILKHENIINYYGSFTRKNRLYIETEYADAGTLADFLASLSNPLEEIEILVLFVQIVSAVVYLHQQNIIHRDIKTTNIFLNKQGFTLLGDFGISKILDSTLDARSFVGTPIYICPEIFEGKAYNKPCDIWALGCVLYEMASLKRTFDGNNLSSLMQKIVQATYMPVNGKYSKRFHKLVRSLLQKNPLKRINSEQLHEKVRSMLNRLSSHEAPIWNGGTFKDMCASESLREYIRKSDNHSLRCSHLYFLNIFSANLNLVPIFFPKQIHLRQLCKGTNHFLALSMDNKVFTWGVALNGALGLGKLASQVASPCLVESLRNQGISKIAAGNGFSVFVTKTGLVFTCGSYRSNCLAHKEPDDLFEPKLVNSLLKMNIFDVSCGTEHVVVISSDGVAFSWGSNRHGQLGIAHSCSFVREPTEVLVPENVKFKKVFCAPEATALIDYGDNLWLCGNNRHNKLNLNRNSLLRFSCVLNALSPQRVRLPGKSSISQIAFGGEHSLVFQESGKILASGCNQGGQLGLQHTKPVSEAIWCHTPRYHKMKAIAAGSNFSLALTSSSVFFWGTRTVKHQTEEPVKLGEGDSSEFVIGRCNESLMELVQAYGPDSPIIKISEPKLVVSKMRDLKVLNSKDSIILSPQSILELYSPKTLQMGEMSLRDIYCFADDSVYVIIDSHLNSLPPPMHKMRANILEKSSNLPTESATATKHSYAWVNDN